MKIPLARVELEDGDLRRMNEVAGSGWLMQGPRVEAFEKSVAESCHVKHAVATSSGTTALHLAMLLLGVKAGDEVIVPSFSFIASANSIRYCGATPVFCDVEGGTYNMAVSFVEPLVTPRTRAILAVHQFGMPCNLEALAALSQEHHLTLVEDAACAIGSTYQGTPIGDCRYSRMACLSFHPRKVVTTGEGGMILTNHAADADRARLLRSHGMAGDRFACLGYNYRLTDLQAALGIGQIKRLPETIARRRVIALQYAHHLQNHPAIQLPAEPPSCQSNYQSFMICLRGGTEERRTQIVADLAEAGIATRPGIPPIHRQACYAATHGDTRLPVTDHLAESGLILPLYAGLTDEQVSLICQTLKRVC